MIAVSLELLELAVYLAPPDPKAHKATADSRAIVAIKDLLEYPDNPAALANAVFPACPARAASLGSKAPPEKEAHKVSRVNLASQVSKV